MTNSGKAHPTPPKDLELGAILDALWGERDLGKAWDAAQVALKAWSDRRTLAIIGEDEVCDGNHGQWVAGCPICERNDIRTEQRKALKADGGGV